jgi:hypothetical protein
MYSFGTFTKKKSSEVKMSIAEVGPVSDIDIRLREETAEVQQFYNEPIDFSKIRSPRANLNVSPRRINVLPITNPLIDIPLSLSNDDYKLQQREQNLLANTIAGFPNQPPTSPKRKAPIRNKPLVLPQNRIVGTPSDLIDVKVPVTSSVAPPISTVLTIPEPTYIDNNEDEIITTILNEYVSISAITGNDSFYHAFLKAFYPPYNTIQGIEYRTNLVNKFKNDLIKLLGVANNYETVGFYDDRKYSYAELKTDVQRLAPTFGMIQFISKTIGINIIIVDNQLNVLYDTNNADFDYIIYLVTNDNANYGVLGRIGIKGIVTVFTGRINVR